MLISNLDESLTHKLPLNRHLCKTNHTLDNLSARSLLSTICLFGLLSSVTMALMCAASAKSGCFVLMYASSISTIFSTFKEKNHHTTWLKDVTYNDKGLFIHQVSSNSNYITNGLTLQKLSEGVMMQESHHSISGRQPGPQKMGDALRDPLV